MAQFWMAGDYDPAALTAALKRQPGLGDYADDLGNLQSAVRLDSDPSDLPARGFWVTYPDGVDASVVQAGASAYEPPAPAPPAPPSPADVLGSIAELDPKTATLADLLALVKAAVS
jgi:hypothetical protein